MARYAEVHAPGNPAVRYELTGPCDWVGPGEGAHGTLRPQGEPSEHAAQVEFFPEKAGVKVLAAQTARVRLVVHGAEVKQALVPWGEDLFLDDVRVSVLEANESDRRKLVSLAVAVAVAAVVAVTFGGSDDARGGAPANEVPAPSLEAAEVGCPTSGSAAEARAVQAERLAMAKRERYGFDARDGVLSLPLFQEAAACFRDAGRLQDAQRVSLSLAAFAQKLGEDYAALRLQLRTARSEKQYAEALRVTRELEALVAARPIDAYSQWLANLHRELEQKIAASREK